MAEITKDHFDKEMGKMAVMIKSGFDSTATKQDLAELKDELKTDIQRIESKVDRA